MRCIFFNSKFKGNLDYWNEFNVENFCKMFANSNFKNSIIKWNMSNGKDFSFMFDDNKYYERNFELNINLNSLDIIKKNKCQKFISK